jgi:hypothetical protein
VRLSVISSNVIFWPSFRPLRPCTLHGGDVHEDVLAAIVWLNEAKALLGVEPFHCAGGHVVKSFSCVAVGLIGCWDASQTCRESGASCKRVREGRRERPNVRPIVDVRLYDTALLPDARAFASNALAMQSVLADTELPPGSIHLFREAHP